MSIFNVHKFTRQNLRDILVVFLFMLSAMLIFVDPSRSILSAATVVFVLVTIGVWLIDSSSARKYTLLVVGLLLFSLAATIVYSVNPELINDRFIKALIALLAIFTFVNSKISEAAARAIGIFSVTAVAVLFLMSFSYYETFFTRGGLVANPNSMALFAAVAGIVAVKTPWLRFAQMVRFTVIAAALITTLQFNSRGAAILIALYLIFSFILSRTRRKKWSLIFMGTVAFAAIIPFTYVSLSENTHFQDTEILGKSIYTGRQSLWLEGFQGNTNQVLFGANDISLFETLDGESFQNAYIDLIYSIGLLLTIAWIAMLYVLVGRDKKVGMASYALLLSILIYSIVESVVVSGTYHGMLIAVALFGIKDGLKDVR